ncbi:hypothetical protein JAAARDRAFT_39423 [Jaapia argillacea MUCL 33604]|uniref:Uncharacterized protein n=1 Tax=Jaapia argillacea MUCL 33604 TaxID=933084 RepID=A0A067PSR8_9AGAM|nr:hypothetical protein JAAARDRAFT_39423 [Jaapia argillacea MUCL 33604]
MPSPLDSISEPSRRPNTCNIERSASTIKMMFFTVLFVQLVTLLFGFVDLTINVVALCLQPPVEIQDTQFALLSPIFNPLIIKTIVHLVYTISLTSTTLPVTIHSLVNPFLTSFTWILKFGLSKLHSAQSIEYQNTALLAELAAIHSAIDVDAMHLSHETTALKLAESQLPTLKRELAHLTNENIELEHAVKTREAYIHSLCVKMGPLVIEKFANNKEVERLEKELCIADEKAQELKDKKTSLLKEKAGLVKETKGLARQQRDIRGELEYTLHALQVYGEEDSQAQAYQAELDSKLVGSPNLDDKEVGGTTVMEIEKIQLEEQVKQLELKEKYMAEVLETEKSLRIEAEEKGRASVEKLLQVNEHLKSGNLAAEKDVAQLKSTLSELEKRVAELQTVQDSYKIISDRFALAEQENLQLKSTIACFSLSSSGSTILELQTVIRGLTLELVAVQEDRTLNAKKVERLEQMDVKAPESNIPPEAMTKVEVVEKEGKENVNVIKLGTSKKTAVILGTRQLN